MSAALKSLSKYYNSYKVIDPKNFDPSNLYEDLVKNLTPYLKEVQKTLKSMDFDSRLERTISMLTGFKTEDL